MGLILRHRCILPRKVKLLLYRALFCSYFNYCTLVWATTTASNLDKLAILEKRVLRIIFDLPYRHTTQHLFRRFDIVSIFNLYRYRLIRNYKHEKRRSLSFLSSLAGLQVFETPYPQRHKPHWSLPSIRTNYGHQLLSYQLPTTLNTLTDEGIDIFKCTLSSLRSFLAEH